MRQARCWTCALVVLFARVPASLADGGFFFVQGDATDLAQTRQEVVLAVHRDAADTVDEVTYVLRTRYAGVPGALAWVVPLPATPTGVVAHASGALFDQLNELTRPTFAIIGRIPSGLGCACGGLASQAGGDQGSLVEVEASGQAGIFKWFSLTSTGSTALRSWLNDNGFAVPAGADSVLDGYIQQAMHFLAIRVNAPEQVQANDEGEIEIPPIQFTCQTSRRFYPIAISRISAATETEVLIYVLAHHRAEAANLSNVLISGDELVYDATQPSLTNYESLFTQKIADLGGTALITECAMPDWYWLYRGIIDWRDETIWPEAPQEARSLSFLTRMRTVMARENMTLDFEFQDAGSDEIVTSDFYVDRSSDAAAASLAGQSLAALLMFGLLRAVMVRRKERKGVRMIYPRLLLYPRDLPSGLAWSIFWCARQRSILS